MTEQQEKVKKTIEKLQDYINSYDKQEGYLDYSNRIIIDDMLYGIGTAIDDKYMYADGYSRFKDILRLHLEEAC